MSTTTTMRTTMTAHPPTRRRRVLFHRINSAPCSFATAEDGPRMMTDSVSQHETASSGQERNDKSSTTSTRPLHTKTMRPTKSCLSHGKLQDLVSSSSSNPQSGMPRKNVSFGHIHIREHPRAVGDHPDVTSGPALALDWYKEDDAAGCPHSRTTVWPSVSAYEEARGRRSRSRDEIRLPRHERQNLLLETGLTFAELHAFVHETAQLQRSRRQSLRDNDESRVPPVVKVLQNVCKLFQPKLKSPLSPFDHDAAQSSSAMEQQRQLDSLMARAQAAERRVRQQHLDSPTADEPPTPDGDGTFTTSDRKQTQLQHPAAELFFLPTALSSDCSETDDDSEEPLEF